MDFVGAFVPCYCSGRLAFDCAGSDYLGSSSGHWQPCSKNSVPDCWPYWSQSFVASRASLPWACSGFASFQRRIGISSGFLFSSWSIWPSSDFGASDWDSFETGGRFDRPRSDCYWRYRTCFSSVILVHDEARDPETNCCWCQCSGPWYHPTWSAAQWCNASNISRSLPCPDWWDPRILPGLFWASSNTASCLRWDRLAFPDWLREWVAFWASKTVHDLFQSKLYWHYMKWN